MAHSKVGSFFQSTNKFPWPLIAGLFLITISPWLLMLFGIDFANHPSQLVINNWLFGNDYDLAQQFFYNGSGVLTHTLLEWTAFCIALLTIFVALNHYRLTHNVTAYVIGIALFFTGFLDVYHLLAADGMIRVFADNKDFIPITWTVARTFNAISILLGVTVLCRGEKHNTRRLSSLVILCNLLLALIAFCIIYYFSNAINLAQTHFPDSFITRPYDMIALIFFIMAGCAVYWRLYDDSTNILTHTLFVFIFAQVAMQCYMVFGASDSFDANFNAAHYIKVIAYVVPLLGLLFDYNMTYKRLTESRRLLEEHATEIDKNHAELDIFAHISSHHFQEPLRKIQVFVSIITQKNKGTISESEKIYLEKISSSAKTMQTLMEKMLSYCHLRKKKRKIETICLRVVIEDAIADLQERINKTKTKIIIGDMPTIQGDFEQIKQLFLNLISNSIKYRNIGEPPKIEISSEPASRDLKKWVGTNAHKITLKDNGIGFDEKDAEKIFMIFQRLHNQSEYEGHGIGLPLCRRIVDIHGGKMTATGIRNQGCVFTIILPDKQNSLEE